MLNQKEAAEYLGVAPRTMEHWRLHGTGPRFVKLGHRTTRYRLADLVAFVDASAVDPAISA